MMDKEKKFAELLKQLSDKKKTELYYMSLGAVFAAKELR